MTIPGKSALLTWLILLAAPTALQAQLTAPSRPAPPPGDEQPAISVTPPSVDRVREDLRDQSGTTIVGERESPIGLYITPWRNAYAAQDADRPARLLQVEIEPLDRDVFARQIEYDRALGEASQAKLAPASPPPAP